MDVVDIGKNGGGSLNGTENYPGVFYRKTVFLHFLSLSSLIGVITNRKMLERSSH